MSPIERDIEMNLVKPTRDSFISVIAYADAMTTYLRLSKIEALKDMRAIDSANKAPKMFYKPLVSRETERERISMHEKAQSNPLLRAMLRSRG